MLDSYSFKTEPYSHQYTALERSAGAEAFALLMEQGTGKTKVIIDNAAMLYNLGRINALVVIAPNGVHRNWCRKEIPAHLPDYVPRRVAWWSSQPKKAEKEAYDKLWEPGQALRVFTINIEAMAMDRCLAEVIKFVKLFDAMVVIDESHRIKTPNTTTTKNVLKLRPLAKYRRILTGTPVAQSPLDVFSQYSFLDPHILPCQSFTAFRARYAEIMSQDHPIIKAIMRKTGKAHGPTMIAVDDSGKPIYKNLDELQRITAPHSYRVLKKDCLDLPPKVYVRASVQLHEKQRALYKQLADRVKNGLKEGEEFSTPVNKLQAVLYFQQILSGIIPKPMDVDGKGVIFEKPSQNPRIRALLDELEGTADQVIVWARFTHDILSIAQSLREVYGPDSVALYYGDVSDDDRMANEDLFQRGERRFLVGNAAAGGTGLTLTAAAQSHYYSNSFKLLDRLQSEDRNHRIGQNAERVRYVDYEVEGSVDSRILQAFINKKDVADAITGDDFSTWIQL